VDAWTKVMRNDRFDLNAIDSGASNVATR